MQSINKSLKDPSWANHIHTFKNQSPEKTTDLRSNKQLTNETKQKLNPIPKLAIIK
jgi:hypothetical protein